MAKKQKPVQQLSTTAIYARYSSSVQNDASIEQQIAECEAYARANNLVIIATYEDRAISGKRDNRPGLQRMLRAADRHEFQVLLAYKSNRISRNMTNALRYEERLAQAGVRVVYCKEEFGDNATGRFMLRTMMNMNQFFSENMAEDIKRGLRDSAMKCKVVATIPYGYKKGEDGKYAVDELAALVVQEIFRRYKNGESYADIARELNSRNLLTKQGKPWSKNSFHNIISNERYTGVYIYDDIRIDGGMPQIVERSVFDVVQKKLVQEKGVRARKRSKENYILTGKLFCGLCLSPMIGMSANGNGGRYLYYMCQGHATKKKCNKANVRKEWLEQEVTKATQIMVLTDDVCLWIAKMMDEATARRVAESKLGEYEKRLSETKKQLQNILRAVEMGVVSDTFAERVKELENEKKELSGLLAFEKATTVRITQVEALTYLQRIKDGDWRDPKFQREILTNFIRAVYLYEDHFKICFDFTGERTVIDCPFTLPNGPDGPDSPDGPDGGGEKADAETSSDTSSVRLETPKVYHYLPKRTIDDESRIEFSESGFVLVWYFDKEKC